MFISFMKCSSWTICRVSSLTSCSLLIFAFFLPVLCASTASRQFNSDCSSSEESIECGTMGQDVELFHVDFEIHGRVQGVFFRKYTQEEGNKLGLRGFCRNTSSGTVSGSMEGPRQAVDKMKHWLQNTGSPMSRISSATFF